MKLKPLCKVRGGCSYDCGLFASKRFKQPTRLPYTGIVAISFVASNLILPPWSSLLGWTPSRKLFHLFCVTLAVPCSLRHVSFCIWPEPSIGVTLRKSLHDGTDWHRNSQNKNAMKAHVCVDRSGSGTCSQFRQRSLHTHTLTSLTHTHTPSHTDEWIDGLMDRWIYIYTHILPIDNYACTRICMHICRIHIHMS